MEMETKFDIQDPKTPWMPKKGEKVTFCFDWVDRQMPSYKVAAGSEGTVQSEMPYVVKVGELTVTVSPSQVRPVKTASKKKAQLQPASDEIIANCLWSAAGGEKRNNLTSNDIIDQAKNYLLDRQYSNVDESVDNFIARHPNLDAVISEFDVIMKKKLSEYDAQIKTADVHVDPKKYECNNCGKRLTKDQMIAGEPTCRNCDYRLRNFDESVKQDQENKSAPFVLPVPRFSQMSEPTSKCTCPPGHSCPSGCPPECQCLRKAGCMASYSIKFPSVELKQEAIETLRKAGFKVAAEPKVVAFTTSDIQEQSPIDQKEVKFAPEGVKENPETWKRYLKLKEKYENMVPESSQTYSGPEFVEYRNLKNYYDQQSIKSTYTDEEFAEEANEYVKTASKKKSDFKVGDIVRNTVSWKNLPKNTLGRVEASTEHYLEIKFANSEMPFAYTGDYLETLHKDERIQNLGSETEIHARLVNEVTAAKKFWKEANLVDIKAASNEFKNEFEQFYGKTVNQESKWDYINFIAPRVSKKVEHYSAKLNNYKNDDGAIYKIAVEDLVYEASTANIKTAVDNERINRFERERQIQRLLSRTHHMGMQFTGNDVVFAPNDQPTGTNPNHAVASPREPEYWIEKAFQYLAKRHYPDATAAYKGIIGCDEAKHMSAEQKERLKRLFISYGLAVEC